MHNSLTPAPGLNSLVISAELDIVSLRDYPNFLPYLAAQHQTQWHSEGAMVSLAERQQRLQTHLNDAEFPSTWLGLRDGTLVGSVSLVHYSSRSAVQAESSVWLANLYVEPQFRQQGIGTVLVDYARNHAAQSGLTELKLFTADQQTFYRQRDWQHSYEARVQGQWVSVMRCVLS